jgi:ankyrin repeat protein
VEEFLNAARAGDIEQLKTLLAANPALLNERNDLGQSAILLARYHRKTAAVEFLLSQNPDLNLHEAAAVGALDRVQTIVRERGRLIDSHSKDGFTALALAAFFGHAAAVQYLIDQGANVSLAANNPMKVAPLHAAVSARHIEIARMLVDNDADVNARQQQGWTPLHGAAQSGDQELVRLLLAKGADREARADTGQTALDLAMTHGHGAVAALLEA